MLPVSRPLRRQAAAESRATSCRGRDGARSICISLPGRDIIVSLDKTMHLGERTMARPVTLFTGQWADLTLEVICQKASKWGYEGIELPCWGDHFNVQKALNDDSYCKGRHDLLGKYGLKIWAISNHLVGQPCSTSSTSGTRLILPDHVWGDGKPEGAAAGPPRR